MRFSPIKPDNFRGDPLVVAAFPPDDPWRLEIQKFKTSLVSFISMMATLTAPKIGE
jgi:hypothetical protein